MSQSLQAGFANPVPDAQQCFRAVLDAMAHPGRITQATGVTAPSPLGTAAAAVVLTLVDHETPLWLDPDAAMARQWIEFHCGAKVVADPDGCAFALAMTLPPLHRFPAGSHESPETSATVVCQADSFVHGKAFRLHGPGLREPLTVTVNGLPRDFASIWQRNHRLFPCGIDLILCAGDSLVAFPRTVAIEEV
jgi:alpha-D-ribose 1-methylphosphonate 5-triphosphate synthase subunit PhnH